MSILTSDLRRQLEHGVAAGRGASESAALSAVSRLGVALRDAPSYLNSEERGLRVALRARARQLGDLLDRADEADVAFRCKLLVREVAYEQWHRILFARFLEANGLLRHPEYGVQVSLAECEELSSELAERDGWSVAARFASEILPGIFKTSDPCVAVRLAGDDLLALERILTALPLEVFTADDSLGWVYQYWQAQAKAEVNESGRKIGGADLAPVTQLFTEDYMVRFLLQNSLGAWWAARRPNSELLTDWDFLRRSDAGLPLAGAFDDWPEAIAEVTVMDPCCGSGHFLVVAFEMLWRMRAEDEGLTPQAAQDAVLRDNLFGLELDPRCVQIALFALALAAWKAGGYRDLPRPNLACSGIPLKAPLSDWTALADGNDRVEAALGRLHALFAGADTLGSLIDPVRTTENEGRGSMDWHEIAPLVQRALATEGGEHAADPAYAVFGEAAAGIARAADYLSRSYTLAATNVPYLKRARQSAELSAHCDVAYPTGKHDLAVAMMQRWSGSVSASAVVSPNGWLFMSWYRQFRRDFLTHNEWLLLAALGTGAFSSITGEVVNVSLLVWSRHPSSSGSVFAAIDAATSSDPKQKEQLLREAPAVARFQRELLADPDARVVVAAVQDHPMLSERAGGFAGICSGDYPRFGRQFWEIQSWGTRWSPQQSTVDSTVAYSGRDHVFMWDGGVGPFREFVEERLGVGKTGAWIRGTDFAGRCGVAVSSMGSLPATLYTGELFDNNTAVILPKAEEDLPAIWAYAESGELSEAVRAIDQSIKVTNATFVKVPFDLDRWRSVAVQRFPNGLPTPSSDDPTQWLFKGVLRGSREPLQVAVARLVGFRWPDQDPDDLDGYADHDGLVCLQAVAGEQSASERVRAIVAAAHGDDASPALLDEFLVSAGGKPGDLDGWLRDVCFKDHCRVFKNRPFVWHVWDGRRDGFAAFINYHRLDRSNLEKLTYTILGWWVDRQRADADSGVAGAEVRLVSALELQRKLSQILEGEPPFDTYIRWKPLAGQALGWDPEVDDGVRMNIRPFVEAGVLRSRLNIHWRKDRGNDPDGAERHNDLHFTLAQKRAARTGLS